MKQLSEYGIDHIGFLVPDIDAAIEHVKERFNVKEIFKGEPFLQKAWTNGKLHTQQCKVALVPFGDHHTKFEFIEPVSEGGYHWDFVKNGESGVNHIGYRINDFDHWKEFFKVKGDEIFFEYEAEDEKLGYRRCMYAKDPLLNFVYEFRENGRYRDSGGILGPYPK